MSRKHVLVLFAVIILSTFYGDLQVDARVTTVIRWQVSSMDAGETITLGNLAWTNSPGTKSWTKSGSCALSRGSLTMGSGRLCVVTLRIAKSGNYPSKVSSKTILIQQPVECPSTANVTVSIDEALDISYRTTGSAVKYYYFTRKVHGFVQNLSSTSISVPYLSLSGNVLRGSTIELSQSVEVLSNVVIRPNTVYSWEVTYEALGHRAYWPDYSPLTRSETVDDFYFRSTDTRCM
jgi:hypothetical protein